jgi:uncharacterized phiE125 gp8 family phage protein
MMTPRATYKVTVAPASEPLTLTELKDRLRVTTTDFDDELTDLLEGARKQVEHDTHRKLITQTVAIYFDDFPTVETLELRIAPISAVSSVGYTDTAGDSQTFSSSNYSEDLDSTPPRLKVVDGVFWPAVDDVPNAVTVTVTAGYGAASAVPVEAKLAIVEWCRMHWGKCDGDRTKYQNLVNSLAWSGHWKAV